MARTDAMPTRPVERRCRLTGYSGEERDAYLRIRSFDRARRIRRAISGLATWCVVAVASVFIPVAHFLLVPAFVIYGLFVFVRRVRITTLVVAARGTCPDCGAEQDLDILGPWHGGHDLSCRACHRSLRLEAR